MTAQQKRLLDFIAGEIARVGISPSYHEMMTHMGLRSKSGIHRLVQALIARGYLAREGYARGMTIPSRDDDWERMRALKELATERWSTDTVQDFRAIFMRLDQQRRLAA
jgi:SOS-response transcriptional repressor LexA